MIFEGLVLLFCLWLNYNANRFSDSKSKKCTYPSYDIFHSNISCKLMHHPYLSDLLLLFTALQWLTVSSQITTASFFLKTAFFYFIRAVTLRLTVGFASPRYYFGLHHNAKNGTNNHFMDLTISGHVGLTTLYCLDLCLLGNNWHRIFAVVNLINSVMMNLLIGDHYSSDLWLGFIIPCLIYW